MDYKYFSDTDFRDADPSCKMSDMNPVFLSDLDVARHLAKVPFIITSAYRTKQHELNKGRDGTSSHIKGMAVDIRASNARVKYQIITALLKAGFTRIFVYKTWIHVDCDPEKDQEVIDNHCPKKETGNHFGI